ncbi:MAG: HAMP domain-containing protein [Desulfuromonas sp.]|nr:HAMP domain-containing protein [Desulfuromonas sp.]
MGSKSIRVRIALWAGICLLITSGINLTVSVISARKEAMADARQMATASAVENMLTIRTELETAMFTARGFAQSVAASKDNQHITPFSRAQLKAMLRRVILENPDFVGGSNCWEPNAFDGRDAEFANTPGHDATGRIGYYWYQDGPGQVAMSYISDFDNEIWYGEPLRKKHETLSEPYWFPIEDEQVLMTTVTVPIQDQGQVFGVATIDLTLGFLQQLVDSAHVFDGYGSMAIISNDGMQVAASGAGQFAGRSLAGVEGYSSQLLASIAQGEAYYDWNEQGMEICVPLVVGKHDEPWGIFIQVPTQWVLASVHALMWQELGGGLISIAIALVLLWVVATKIAKPIRQGAEMAESIGRGDLSTRLKLNRSDEVGKLADAMNRMAESLAGKADLAENIATDERQQRMALATELDVLGMSLQSMTRNLNKVLFEVDRGCEQIIHGSEEICELSHFLTLGTTQQTNLVEQVSRGVGDVAAQTQINSQHARQTIELSVQLNRSLERSDLKVQALQDALAGADDGRGGDIDALATELATALTTIADLGELVGEMLDVSDEQSQDLQRLNQGLNQICRVSQYNSAQFEKGLSVAEQLSEQAAALSHELQRFKLLERINAVDEPGGEV